MYNQNNYPGKIPYPLGGGGQNPYPPNSGNPVPGPLTGYPPVPAPYSGHPPVPVSPSLPRNNSTSPTNPFTVAPPGQVNLYAPMGMQCGNQGPFPAQPYYPTQNLPPPMYQAYQGPTQNYQTYTSPHPPQDRSISFRNFVRIINVIALGSAVAKLILVFKLFRSLHKSQTIPVQSMISAMHYISTIMAYFGCFPKVEPQKVVEDMSIHFKEHETVNITQFVEVGSDSLDTILCCGLLQFVVNYTLERVVFQNNPSCPVIGWMPYKEGFLLKEFSKVLQKWSYHWCVVSHGFFYYYNDLVKYEKIQRSTSLINVVIDKFSYISTESDKRHYGFRLTVPPEYDRKFVCSSKKELESWIEILEFNATGQRNRPAWYWNTKDKWTPFDPAAVKILEEAYYEGATTCVLQSQDLVPQTTTKDISYTFDFKNWKQTNIQTRKTRDIRRQMDSIEDPLHPGLHNRFKSRFPVRYDVKGSFICDGKEGYQAISAALRGAKESIFLADWFFSSEVFLIREGGQLEESDRLINVLKKKSYEGVLICILIWNETKIATTLNSENVQNVLENINLNIRVVRHPLNYPVAWSHHQKIVVVDQDVAFVGGLDLCFGRWDDCNHNLVDVEGKVWPGKDYYNPFVTTIDHVEDYEKDGFDRTKLPRMPWHDVHIRLEGQPARDIAINFIERWNFSKIQLERITVQTLKPKLGFCQHPHQGTLAVQVLRSLGDWHLSNYFGKPPEISIYHAYLHFIEHAEHFIYIENQYFISSLAGSAVSNTIAHAILQRIIKAITNNEIFRVIIILPVHPEGTFKDAGIRYIMKWQYNTINRYKTSLLAQLKAKYPDIKPEQYITFNALRKAQYMPTTGTYVTEQIYVHSKLMIVDDRVVIIGSANINDRSMLGNRDSEIAVVVEDNDVVNIQMNGKPYEARVFAHNFRKKLWAEHLGVTSGTDDSFMNDPIHPVTWNDVWLETAKNNTEIFRKLFPEAPSDDILKLEDLRLRSTMEFSDMVTMAKKEVPRLKGHLINFPLNFLGGESLSPDFDAVEIKIADADIFT